MRIKKSCPLCRQKINKIDYTNTALLQRFLWPWQKIKPNSNTYLCVKHQKHIASAIKTARQMALLPTKP
ncbi:30S ribosomal protein S18 [Candidatus Berkelbacteria bacterium]|nr:30S ribosomal protein S18 [Candidatus Berkelbacteria bacterium]MBI2588122.1 30S ribosomal protein S18 [Candidatus Berkelbacteria bacterium]MBI4029697.1 30S ribosomal protein S18 [Candidatus Berkelbacteria bacterium]